jgi:hypothetical protein
MPFTEKLDPAKLKAGRKQLEAELQQMRAARVQAGEAVAVNAVAVVGTPDAADAAIKSLKASKLAELRAAGDEREVYFVQPWNGEELAKLRAGEKLDALYDKEPLVIITGVPRAGRDASEADGNPVA